MATDFDSYVLADSNGDLIELYLLVADEFREFNAYAKSMFVPENNRPDRYYHLRDRFNEIRLDPWTCVQVERAAIFLYLNRHCYNGLCRYNSRGGFNVPFGRYRKPYYPEAELRHFHQKANERHLELYVMDYRRTMLAMTRPGDSLYLDPPYLPENNKAEGFTAYNSKGFGMADHLELTRLAAQAARSGVQVVLSNHSRHDINKTYREYGARLHFHSQPRAINSKTIGRIPAREVLAVWDGSNS